MTRRIAAGTATIRAGRRGRRPAAPAARRVAATRHAWIGAAGRPARDAASGADRRPADFRASTTDPAATPTPLGDGRARLGDQGHDVADGGKARVVLMAPVAPAEAPEHQPALDRRGRARFRWQPRPRQGTGDTKHGTVEHVAASERERSRADVPRPAAGRRPGLFAGTDSADDAAADADRRPGGETRRFNAQGDTARRRGSGAPAAAGAAGAAGALRSRCPPSQRGRRVGRNLDEACLERARGSHATGPFAQARRQRQVWAEPRFAAAEDWHGRRRCRLRGLPKVHGGAPVVAAGQTRKRRLSRRGRGRRPGPNGAAGLVPPAPAPAPTARGGRAAPRHAAPSGSAQARGSPFPTGWAVFETGLLTTVVDHWERPHGGGSGSVSPAPGG